jgi:hypothetical protein
LPLANQTAQPPHQKTKHSQPGSRHVKVENLLHMPILFDWRVKHTSPKSSRIIIGEYCQKDNFLNPKKHSQNTKSEIVVINNTVTTGRSARPGSSPACPLITHRQLDHCHIDRHQESEKAAPAEASRAYGFGRHARQSDRQR